MNIQTLCKDCVFAKYNNETLQQEGCTLERVEKLGIDSVEDKNFQLKRVCNAHRPTEWVGMLDFEESLDPEKTVLEELYPRMGYFVRLKTDDPDCIEGLKLTMRSITSVKGKPPAYVVVITDRVEFNEEIWTEFLIHFGELNEHTKYHVLQITETPEQIQNVIDAAFNYAENSWIMTTSSGCIVREDTTDILNKIINIDMKQKILVEPYDDYNGMIFPAYLFKFLNGNKIKVFQDEMVDGRGFLEKVRDAAERGASDSLMTWEEFYAS